MQTASRSKSLKARDQQHSHTRLPDQRCSWQLHRRTGAVGCSTRSSGFPGGTDAGDEKTEAAGDQWPTKKVHGSVAPSG